jgi:hypothetical protein
MKTAVLRYATPFIMGLFLVSLVSGIALFFHLGQPWFHSMHEWLSMVLILPFILHLWKNWRPFSNYFKRLPMAFALGVSLVASLYYVVGTGTPGERTGGPPQFAFASRIMQNSVTQLAPLLATTPEALQQRLADAGFANVKLDMPLNEAVTRSGKNEGQLMQTLLQASK